MDGRPHHVGRDLPHLRDPVTQGTSHNPVMMGGWVDPGDWLHRPNRTRQADQDQRSTAV